MKYRIYSNFRFLISGPLAAVLLTAAAAPAEAQGKKTAKSKSSPAAKAPAKSPGAATKYDQHLAANLKLLNVLRRYADALAGATNPATAALAVPQIETITKDAITAGEEIVKLGRPAPELEAKLAKDADLEMTSRNVAEQTRSAVKSLSANAEVKSILTPVIGNFQAALNRIQQAADDPNGPVVPAKPQETTVKSATSESGPAKPAPAPGTKTPPATTAAEATSVPPPPE